MCHGQVTWLVFPITRMVIPFWGFWVCCMKLHGTNTNKTSTCYPSLQPRKTTSSTTQRSSLHVASLSNGNVLWTSWRKWQTLRRDGSSLTYQTYHNRKLSVSFREQPICNEFISSCSWTDHSVDSYSANYVPGRCEWRDLQCCKESVRADAAKATQFQWSLDRGVWVVAAHAHAGDQNASRPCCSRTSFDWFHLISLGKE